MRWSPAIVVLTWACTAPLQPGDVEGIWVGVVHAGSALPIREGPPYYRAVIADTMSLIHGEWIWRTTRTRRRGRGFPEDTSVLDLRGTYSFGRGEVRLRATIVWCEFSCDGPPWVGRLTEAGRLVFERGFEYVRGQGEPPN